MTNSLKPYLSNFLNESITNIAPIGGGDISEAFKIDTASTNYFLKLNSANALHMFKTEAKGLQLIGKTNTIKTPKIYAYNVFENVAFLLMEFIDGITPTAKDFNRLGEQLAKLHQCTSNSFGLQHDNFIGSLPQSNLQHRHWIDFYTNERLLPQLNLAQQKGLLSSAECPTKETIKKALDYLFKNIKPSLLHGDLWSGNYLISKNGTPYLIDPAVYYGHSEVDIAMSKLFGGFGDAFFKAYHSHIPKDEHTKARIEIYQLYYLLVHLNLFGRSYYGSVVSIFKNYFA